jgi:hypothetical protein
MLLVVSATGKQLPTAGCKFLPMPATGPGCTTIVLHDDLQYRTEGGEQRAHAFN